MSLLGALQQPATPCANGLVGMDVSLARGVPEDLERISQYAGDLVKLRGDAEVVHCGPDGRIIGNGH